MKKEIQKRGFEESLVRLQELIRQLEDPNVNLDVAMVTFEEGLTISRALQKTLEEAEQRVFSMTETGLEASSSGKAAEDEEDSRT